jgi:3-isopropylmalate/(R)-2-methylmalate dehydratase small subunit
MFESVEKNPLSLLTVDLENQTIKNNVTGKSEKFAINAYKKECFLKGFDDIDYLLNKKEIIEAYERKVY